MTANGWKHFLFECALASFVVLYIGVEVGWKPAMLSLGVAVAAFCAGLIWSAEHHA